MSLNWETLDIIEGDVDTTACECCGKATMQVNGDIQMSDGTWVAFYWVRYAQAHPEVYPIFRFGTGNWSDDAPADARWVIGIEYNVEQEGCRLLDLSSERGEVPATYLNRDDIVGSEFASDVFAYFDAVFMKDSRLKELRHDA